MAGYSRNIDSSRRGPRSAAAPAPRGNGQRRAILAAVAFACLLACSIVCPPCHSLMGAAQALAATPMIVAGYNHAVELRADGAVWTWGANVDFQLGDGTPNWRMTPAPVGGLPSIKAVAAGYDFSVALDDAGGLWTWGANYVGQLGEIPDGQNSRMTPAKVAAAGLPRFKAVAAGYQHVLAVDESGTVWSFGSDEKSQLGDRFPNQGDYVENGSPAKLRNLNGVKAVAAGKFHSMALLEDGRVFCWGSASDGSLGNGVTTIIDFPQPQAVSGLAGAVAIAAGLGHSVAVLGDGTVWTWGLNANGQLGDGSTVSRNAPVKVPGLTGVMAAAAGTAHTLALGQDGAVWAWGYDHNGQLGDGSTTERHAPVRAQTPMGATSLAAGENHSLAVIGGANPWTWSWGLNDSGQLGSGSQIPRSVPGPIALSEANLRAVTAVTGFGGAISPSGLTAVPQGAPVSFTIAPTPGFAISRIDVTTGGVKRNEPISATLTLASVTADTLVEVYFRRLDGYVISVQAEPGGVVSPTGVIQVAPGASQSFTAAPNKGWRVKDVLIDGVSIGPVKAFTLGNASRDRSVRVSFAKAGPPMAALALLLQPSSYLVSASAGTGGVITPSGQVLVPRGGSRTFLITPGNGMRIRDVLVNGVSMGPVQTLTLANLTEDSVIEAFFSRISPPLLPILFGSAP